MNYDSVRESRRLEKEIWIGLVGGIRDEVLVRTDKLIEWVLYILLTTFEVGQKI